MKTKFLKLLFLIFFAQNTYSQCFEIESILVDACGAQEGLNEMVRFKIGDAPLNTSTLNVSWPNNSWQGLIQNATTATKVATLNADILAAGGCGEIIEPLGGVLPANASVILVTSFNFDTALNSFGALSEDIYIIFQNNPAITSGHFANFGTGLRTLTMFLGPCVDLVTYDRSLLVSPTGETTASDGATVLFTPEGIASYVNYGCSAPVQPFLVEINTPSISACPGDTIDLTATAEGQQSVLWSAPIGSFSNSGALATSYTIPSNATGTILLTLTATNSCGLEISDTVLVTITNNVVPDFDTTLTLCNGSEAPTLETTSPNGIVGTWSPAIINNTTSGNYVFTPNENQCASAVTLVVTVTNKIVPDFATTLTLCTGTSAPTLEETSPNGIVGTWNPSTINNTMGGNYIFTPDENQCASPITLVVTVTNTIVPDFDTTLTLCAGLTAPMLETTSLNGISGFWTPNTIDTTESASYLFTPTSNPCASTFTLNVIVVDSIEPDFDDELTLCNGSQAPTLETTSPNGISGFWTPNTIDTTESASYLFTPINSPCASTVTLEVTITDFDFTLNEKCDDRNFIIESILENPSADANYEWTLENSSAVLSQESFLNVTELLNSNGITNVFPKTFSLKIVTDEGCEETKPITIFNAFCGIPKGISPNNDGLNDSFDLTGLGVESISIFNRYGRKIYSKNNYLNEWYGQSDNGHELPDGTYYYLLNKSDGKQVTGWVYINRQVN